MSEHWCTPDCIDLDTWDADCPLNEGLDGAEMLRKSNERWAKFAQQGVEYDADRNGELDGYDALDNDETS